MNKKFIIFLFLSLIAHCGLCFSDELDGSASGQAKYQESTNNELSATEINLAKKILSYFSNLHEMNADFIQIDSKNKKSGAGKLNLNDNTFSITYSEPKEFTLEYSNSDHLVFYSDKSSANKRAIKIHSCVFDVFFCKDEDQILSNMNISIEDEKISARVKSNFDEIFLIFNVQDENLVLSSIHANTSKLNLTMVLSNLHYVAKNVQKQANK